MRLKKDDTVKILAGADKGFTGKVVKVDPVKERVIVQGANMVRKTMKKKNAQDKGGIMEVEAPISASNVVLVSKGNASKVGYKMEGGKKVRYAKKTGETL